MRAGSVVSIGVLLALSACLVTTREGTPLAQGVRYACSYVHDREQLETSQCGPAGDPGWVVDHFDYAADPGSDVVCRQTPTGLCTYEPDHLGWDERH